MAAPVALSEQEASDEEALSEQEASDEEAQAEEWMVSDDEDAVTIRYNPDQERDDYGRWTSGGGEVKQAKDSRAWMKGLSKHEEAAIDQWSQGIGCKWMRIVDAGEDRIKVDPRYEVAVGPAEGYAYWRQELSVLKEACAKAPNYQGKAYRGSLIFDKEQFLADHQVGAKVKLDAITSFSSSEDSTTWFAAERQAAAASVLYEVDTKIGAPIGPYLDQDRSPNMKEHELLVPKGAAFQITEVTPATYSRRAGFRPMKNTEENRVKAKAFIVRARSINRRAGRRAAPTRLDRALDG